MPIRDEAAMNRSLDNDYGDDHGPNSPASFLVALFVGDPMIAAIDGGGVEANSTDQPGYARVAISHSDFPAAADGLKTLQVAFPATTGEWSPSVTHWAILDASTLDMWDTGELSEEFDVTGAGPSPVVECDIYYGNNVTFEE